MPVTTACIICEKVGFVRREYVIRGGLTYSEYYCGACEHFWIVRDENERRSKPRPIRRPATGVS